MQNITHQSALKQLVLYGIVGVTNNFLGYILYLMLTHFGAGHKMSMTFLYIVGVIISFWANKEFVFKYEGGMIAPSIKFGIAHTIGYLLNLGLLFFLTDKLGYSHQYVQAAAIFIVAGYLFVALRFFVFTKKMAL